MQGDILMAIRLTQSIAQLQPLSYNWGLLADLTSHDRQLMILIVLTIARALSSLENSYCCGTKILMENSVPNSLLTH